MTLEILLIFVPIAIGLLSVVFFSAPTAQKISDVAVKEEPKLEVANVEDEKVEEKIEEEKFEEKLEEKIEEEKVAEKEKRLRFWSVSWQKI